MKGWLGSLENIGVALLFGGVSEDSDARFALMGCLGLRIAHLRILLLEACTPLNPHHLRNRDYNYRSSHVSPFGV